jgi:hypothetical protein
MELMLLREVGRHVRIGGGTTDFRGDRAEFENWQNNFPVLGQSC